MTTPCGKGVRPWCVMSARSKCTFRTLTPHLVRCCCRRPGRTPGVPSHSKADCHGAPHPAGPVPGTLSFTLLSVATIPLLTRPHGKVFRLPEASVRYSAPFSCCRTASSFPPMSITFRDSATIWLIVSVVGVTHPSWAFCPPNDPRYLGRPFRIPAREGSLWLPGSCLKNAGLLYPCRVELKPETFGESVQHSVCGRPTFGLSGYCESASAHSPPSQKK